MFCEKCGAELQEEMKTCPRCGAEEAIAKDVRQNEPNTYKRKRTTNASVWSVLSVFSLLSSFFTLYKGIDRLVNYVNSDYSWRTVNAYVGGDAYNYIINGTHATAFFVLTAMFVLAAIGLMALHYLSKLEKQ